MILAKPPEVISLDPQLLGDIIENIRLVGRATGTEQKADEIASDMQTRIEAVAARAADADTHPSVLHVEWADPLMCGGHWVPEMVDLAGGSNTFGDKDTGTFKLEWEEVVARQPEGHRDDALRLRREARPGGRADSGATGWLEGPPCRPATTGSTWWTPAPTPAAPAPAW